MTIIECDQCGQVRKTVPGLTPIPHNYGLRDFDHNYQFCSSKCRVEWMRVRGELEDFMNETLDSAG